MQSLERLWLALEDIPGVTAVLAEWQTQLDSTFEYAQPFLRPIDELAGCYPPAVGHIQPYRLVEHGPDEFAAVPPNGGQTILLKRADVLLYRFDHLKLAQRIAAAFKFAVEFSEVGGLSLTWRIGSFQTARGPSVPVYLTFPFESADLQSTIQAIAAQIGQPYVVIAPTRRSLKPAAESTLQITRGHLIALCNAMTVGAGDAWQVSPDALRTLVAFCNGGASGGNEPLSERAQSILIAMLELGAIDSDHRRSTDEIAPKAFGSSADGNSLKPVVAELRSRRLVETKEGRGGGCWLTDDGHVRANRCRKP